MIARATRSAIEAEIRAARARSNAAIAARDVAGMKALFVPDAVVLPGGSGTPAGMEGFEERIGAAFVDPDFVGWERVPETILIASDEARAAETGTWTGTWRKLDGFGRTTGIYPAMWVPTPGG